METDKRTTHEIVCVGLAEATTSKKLIPRFREVVDGKIVPHGEPYAWTGVKASPGNVYSIDAAEWSAEAHTVYIPKGGRLLWLRLWPDAAQRAAWEADARTMQAQKARTAMQADAERQNELKELCLPLSRAYHALPWGQKTAFLVMVQELIVRNVPKKGE